MAANTFPVGGRRTWLGILTLVGVLGIVEVSVIAFLGHAFLPAPIAWALDAVGVLLLVLSAFAIASVTWRRHVVTDTEVLLVLGYVAQVRVPLATVSSVTGMPPLDAHQADRVGPTLVDGLLTLVAATGVPRTHLEFTEPHIGRRLWQRRPVTRVDVSDASGQLAASVADRLAR